MTANAFIGYGEAPTYAELTAALGSARALWDQVVTQITESLGVEDQEWSSYSAKAGWAMRLRHKGRRIVYLSPSTGSFMASFALSDRAVEAARNSDLPAEVVAIVNAARRYAEGTGVRIEVRSAEDVASVVKLAGIKLAN